MGWKFERFEAIPGGSGGCAHSHATLCQRILNDGHPQAMICEDDLLFSTNAKKFLQESEDLLNTISFDLFHLGPTLHKPLIQKEKNLLCLHHASPTTDKFRGILGTTAYVVTPKACEAILRWNSTFELPETSHLKLWDNATEIWPIDQFFDAYVYHVCKSQTYKEPITIQYNSISDTEGRYQNVEYLMTYNWNLYTSQLRT